MKKLLSLVVAVVCATLLVGTCAFAAEAPASDIEAIQEKGVFVVGITDFAPMDFKDENGEWIGFDADLARAFAAGLGVEIEFQEIEWDNKILELNSGAVDCIWNGMTLTPEVADAMDCSITYALNAQVVVMATDKIAEYPDVESMKDLAFAVEAGSAGEEVATEAGLNANPVTSQAAALMEVAAGTSDACVIDMTMAEAMTGEGTSYENLGYEVVLSSEEYVVGFRKGSDCVLALNIMLLLLNEEGALEEISAEYDNAVSIADMSEVDIDVDKILAEAAAAEEAAAE